jgi:hypothetical protein
MIKKSFLEGHYSPWTGMEVSKWEIILEQFLVMEVIVK